MSSTLSHQSIAEICTLVPRLRQADNLPNKEWCFIVDNCVAPFRGDPDDLLPAEYFSSDGFRITVGKHTLDEALDIVFSPGHPLLLWNAAPEGFIEGILERYRTQCKKPLAMREVTISKVNITDVWINAYYTSFPCRQCSIRVANEQVFHLTPPEAHECLSLKYSPYRIGSRDVPERHQRLEIVNCRHDGEIVNCRHDRSLLRFADLRYEAWRFLPRASLDTILLVNRLWSAEVNERGTQLALRELEYLSFTYYPEVQGLCFTVADAKSELGSNRTFMLWRNADIDSAIPVNHLRNCEAPSSVFDFYVEDDEDEDIVSLDNSIGPWINKLLCSVKNFRFEILFLHLQQVNAADAADFLISTRHALDSRNFNGLRHVYLELAYEALEVLIDEHFLQRSSLQNMETIDLEICLRGSDAPGNHRWTRGLFELPTCKDFTIHFTPEGDYAPDYAEQMFVVLQEVMKQFESASDVSRFPNNCELILVQPDPTWRDQEPAPTFSNVSVPLLGGLWNVYVTKNKATNAPLSIYVNPPENTEIHAYVHYTRRFICRKELYNVELAKTSRPRKRCLKWP